MLFLFSFFLFKLYNYAMDREINLKAVSTSYGKEHKMVDQEGICRKLILKIWSKNIQQ